MKKKNMQTKYLTKGAEGSQLSPEIMGVIGTELKRRRLSQSRTLDSFDCKCSISYISKIENGKIKPNFKVLRELCTEQGITQAELEALMKINSLIEEVCSAIFYQMPIDLYAIGLKIVEFDNYKVNLLKALCALIESDWEKIRQLLPTIEIIRNRLSDSDNNLYQYLQMALANHEGHHFLAHAYYGEVSKNTNPLFDALCFSEYFISICECSFENPTHYYSQLVEIYHGLYNNNLLKFSKCYFRALMRLGTTIPTMILDTFPLSERILYYLRHKMYDELFALRDNYALSNYENFIIAIACKEYDKAGHYYDEINMTNLEMQDVIIINYCRLLIENNLATIIDYLMKTILEYAYTSGNFPMIVYFTNELCNYAAEYGKYKFIVNNCLSVNKYIEDYQKYIRI